MYEGVSDVQALPFRHAEFKAGMSLGGSLVVFVAFRNVTGSLHNIVLGQDVVWLCDRLCFRFPCGQSLSMRGGAHSEYQLWVVYIAGHRLLCLDAAPQPEEAHARSDAKVWHSKLDNSGSRVFSKSGLHLHRISNFRL